MNNVHPIFQSILAGIAPSVAPDLTGRQARCGCGKLAPSSPKLFGFEYRGAGSQYAQIACKHCGYFDVAHGTGKPHLKHIEGHAFEPHGSYEFDSYYCGCRGWD